MASKLGAYLTKVYKCELVSKLEKQDDESTDTATVARERACVFVPLL